MRMGIFLKSLFIFRNRFPLSLNNGGYIIPFTFFLIFTFTTLTLYAGREYVMEKQFFMQAEKFRRLELLLFFAEQDLKQILTEEKELSSGKIEYTIGYVTYNVEQRESERITFAIGCYTADGGSLQGILVYDMEAGDFILWKNK